MQHHMDMTHFALFEAAVIIIAVFGVTGYLAAIYVSYKKDRQWPLARILLWVLGVAAAVLPLAGPLADLAHHNFTAHMWGHLLLGMLAPLLLVFAKPMTLLMRALSTDMAKSLSKILRSRYVQVISNPLVASILNIGGLFVLYMTDLFTLMHTSVWLFALVHLHVFLAGYLFTISIIYVDLNSHHHTFTYRAVILVLALGFHKVLSKMIYAAPPEGVATADAQTGGMVMYYGGDIIDLILIIVLCYEWYRSRVRQPSLQ